MRLRSLLVPILGVSLIATCSFSACAKVSVSPQSAEHPDPVSHYQVIETERFMPAWIEVCDFEFSDSSVTENGDPLNRAVNLLRKSSAEDRRAEIAHDAAAALSVSTVRRLDQAGLTAVRIPYNDDVLYPGNNLLVTGRFIDVDEGNRLARVGIGLGAGVSRLDTEVHVYRVSHGERAEVLAFTTHADSGKMPGLAESLPLGVFLIGPITVFTAIEDSASTGQKIYSSEIDYLAGETGDQIARYLSQYSAEELWIPPESANSPNLVAAGANGRDGAADQAGAGFWRPSHMAAYLSAPP